MSDAASSYDCPDCGEALPDEVGVQTCECGFVCETFPEDADIPEDVVRIDWPTLVEEDSHAR